MSNITSWVRKGMQLNRTIRNLKDEDKHNWKTVYYSDTDEGKSARRRYNLGKYLKKKRKALPRTYRDRAITRIIEDEQEAQAVQEQNEALIAQIGAEQERLEHRERELRRLLFQRYEPGVERRLASEGLSIEEIERRSEAGRSVADDLVRRNQRAPIILQEILREADRASHEMFRRMQERVNVDDELHYDDELDDDDDDDDEQSVQTLGGQGRSRRKKTRRKKTRRKKTRRKK
tara:strand:+ start:178 stop:876 length:699 start_codon:yes stop_codon:yes gene_type:complete